MKTKKINDLDTNFSDVHDWIENLNINSISRINIIGVDDYSANIEIYTHQFTYGISFKKAKDDNNPGIIIAMISDKELTGSNDFYEGTYYPFSFSELRNKIKKCEEYHNR